MDPDELEESTINPREKAIQWFCNHWTADELTKIIHNSTIFDSSVTKLIKYFTNSDDEVLLLNQEKLANILYDLVGTRFLRNEKFLELILKAAVKNDSNKEFTKSILNEASKFAHGKTLTELESVVKLDKTRGWMINLANLLKLPPSCGLNPISENQPKMEEIRPHKYMNPLYDYQFSLSLKIKSMLTGQTGKQRGIITLPTGAGKTRLVVESIIEWINEGKKGHPTSPFVLWIAQSEELCSQAFETFKLVFQDKGREDSVLVLHRLWGKNNKLPKLDDDGVIVANIGMLDSIAKRFPKRLSALADLVSCIIIDEAHHSTAESYTRVLEAFGFNFRMKNPSTKNIVLLGLTATPFRQNIDSDETRRLKNRYEENIIIPDVTSLDIIKENQLPHALIDSQSVATVGEKVRFEGDRSYDKDGKIMKYDWQIYDQNNQLIREYPNSQNIVHTFDKPQRFKIKLQVTDNEGDVGQTETFVDVINDAAISNLTDVEKMKHVQDKLTKRGILCPIIYHELQIMNSQYVLTKSGQKHLEQFKDLDNRTLSKLGEDPERNIKLLEKIREITRELKPPRKSVLLFTCSVKHAKNVSSILNTCLGIKAAYVAGEMDRQERLEAIRKFRTGEIEVLCNYGVLTTGYDSPNIDCVIVGRPTMSQLLYTQMVGRGLRGEKSGGTKDCLIIDVKDKIRKYKSNEKLDLVWAQSVGLWEEQESEETTPSEPIEIHPEEGLKGVSHTCPRCGITATGHLEIVEKFGLTNARISWNNPYGIQSHCRSCRSIKKGEPEKPDLIQSEQMKAIVHYKKLKNELGYTPTSRQYFQSMPPINEESIKKYFNSYFELQKQQGDNPQENEILREKILDDFFEIYNKLGNSINKDDIEKNGRFKLSDYVECFGSMENLGDLLKPIIKNLKNIAPVDNDKIKRDYLKVRRKIGNAPTFDQVRLNSDLGIEHYIHNFGTFGKLKKELEDVISKSNQDISRLKEDFVRIKDQLGITPTFTQMMKHSDHYHWILKIYGSYDEFLNSIGEKEEFKIIPNEVKDKKKKELIDKFVSWSKEMGPYKAVEKLMSDNDISYTEWFGSKISFVNALREIDSNIITIWAKIKAKELTTSLATNLNNISSKTSVRKPNSPVKIRNVSKLTKCPICKHRDLRKAGKDRKYCFNCGWDSLVGVDSCF